ncbi:MAG: adenosylcobalamin-dependent ribonucleoside-diphosphate reductase [Patescibacteria group bacterium]
MTKLSDLAQKVFFDRYALKNSEGKRVEDTPEEMWHRVAKSISTVESTPDKQEHWEKEFYSILDGFKFVPAGRILTGAGSGVPLTYYNCFVIPSPEDSRGGIFDSVKMMVEIMARGGGVGVNLSSLRPRGTYVKGVNGTASGSVSFGGLYSFATGLVIQGGSRRGALMLMLNDHHPDVEEFITVKRTMGLVTNANLSVCLSDAFMDAVKADADWDLHYGGKVYKTIKAKSLWNLISESAWASGEPGLMFIDRYNKQSNSWYFEKIIATNPCGEQGLPAWGVCNLGAINLGNFVQDEKIAWDDLRRTVRISMRFLDNVVDSTYYFFDENKKQQKSIRRTGLGTMGLADLLIKMKVRYGSARAIEICDEVYQFVRDEGYRMSMEIAQEKGPFPMFDKEKFAQGVFIKRLPEDLQKSIYKHGIRNGVILTQAPTGTTSILANASSGIEPVYDFAFKRKDRLGEHVVYYPMYKDWLDANPNAVKPDYFTTAKELTPEEHVNMQAIIQKYTDSSISKTVNAPESHTTEQVQSLYMKAYDLGCKGIAYFRDNSRDVSVLESLDKKGKGEGEKSATPVAAQTQQPVLRPQPKPRPEVVYGATYKVKTGYGTLFVTVNHDEVGQPFEVFATIGKAGGFFQAKSEAICRLISLALRSGLDPRTVIDQIKGIRGPMPAWTSKGQILSIPDAIAHVLEEHLQGPQSKLALKFAEEAKLQATSQADLLKEAHLEPVKDMTAGQEVPSMTQVQEALVAGVSAKPSASLSRSGGSIADHGLAPECPDCGGVLALQEGCLTCHGCGFSKCT